MSVINFFKSFYISLVNFGDSLQSLFLLATRVVWGLLFYIAGTAKLADIPSAVNNFRNLHVPFPEFSAPFVGWVELIGGICLIIGFASRKVSIPLLCVIFGAFLTLHYPELVEVTSKPATFLQSAPFTYLFALFLIFIFGPGKISVDYVLEQLIGSGRKS